MTFKKWPSIENSYRERFIYPFLGQYPELNDETFVITEKLHGCLPNTGRIRMVDGSWKFIGTVDVGDIVLGYRNGIVVPSKVLRTYRNKKGKQWLKVKGTRYRVGRGGYEFVVKCTPEHRFYLPQQREYVEAKDLAIGDKVFSVRTDLGLTPIQKQVILGKLLGDGYLHIQESNQSASICWGHSEKQKEYCVWTAKALNGLVESKMEQYKSGYGSVMYRLRTVFSYPILEVFNQFYNDDGKIIPDWVSDEITPISLAVWYMDDGGLQHNEGQEDRAAFATNAFSDRDCLVLLEGLSKYGIDARYKDWGSGNRIVLNADNAEMLFLLISPYIPKCMQYKLPERYRGAPDWFPVDSEMKYKATLIEQEITSIEVENFPRGKEKFDIETETGNYFAHGILVHNSNLQLYFEPNKPYRVGSRNRFLKTDDKFYNIWNVLERYQDLISEYQKMVDKTGRTVRLFGELFGGGIQKGVKYQQEQKIAFFGMMVEDSLVNFKTFRDVISLLGFSNLVVPIVALGVQGLDNALAYETEFDSKVLGIDDNVCEGIVIQPYSKTYQSHAGSYFILKAKNEAFKEKAHAKKVVVVDSKLQGLNIEFRRYITDNRVQGVFSKYGEIETPKQIGQYIRYMMEDAKVDFIKDNPDVAEMNKKDQKQVFNVGGTIANMLKGYL